MRAYFNERAALERGQAWLSSGSGATTVNAETRACLESICGTKSKGFHLKLLSSAFFPYFAFLPAGLRLFRLLHHQEILTGSSKSVTRDLLPRFSSPPTPTSTPLSPSPIFFNPLRCGLNRRVDAIAVPLSIAYNAIGLPFHCQDFENPTNGIEVRASLNVKGNSKEIWKWKVSFSRARGRGGGGGMQNR